MAEYHLGLPARRLRPAEPPLLQALGADPPPAAIPEQEFQAIPWRVGESEHMPAQRIAPQPVARQIRIARPLYTFDPIGVDLDQSLYAMDSTTIDLCLSLFPWARFRKHKAAVKMHTLLDLHGNIPTFISITAGKVHDVNVLDEILPEAGAFYVMDRGYVDFQRLFI